MQPSQIVWQLCAKQTPIHTPYLLSITLAPRFFFLFSTRAFPVVLGP